MNFYGLDQHPISRKFDGSVLDAINAVVSFPSLVEDDL